MTHRVPLDIQRQLHQMYPEVKNLNDIINSVFELIREKAIDDGSCTIQTFGTFYTYKALSRKRGCFVPRFKFRISRALMDAMCTDSYTLQRIDHVMNRIIDAKKKFNNEEIVETRNLNYKAQTNITNNQRIVRKHTAEKIVQDEINKILGEEFENK